MAIDEKLDPVAILFVYQNGKIELVVVEGQLTLTYWPLSNFNNVADYVHEYVLWSFCVMNATAHWTSLMISHQWFR